MEGGREEEWREIRIGIRKVRGYSWDQEGGTGVGMGYWDVFSEELRGGIGRGTGTMNASL